MTQKINKTSNISKSVLLLLNGIMGMNWDFV